MKRLLAICGFIGTLLIFVGCTVDATKAQSASATLDEPLVNTYWKLTRLNGAPVVTHENVREAHLVLHQDASRLAGATGCNTLMGSYLLENEHIEFSQIASTKMACPTTQMKTESDFLASLKQVTAWHVDGAMLVLSDANSKPLATFEAVYLY
ncbi:META domain-containing protein [Halomonas sp. ISL-60]|uniref:META domain-containing protein n=1 Tax=Halomonas sp. ISL-56 TaxID=2819149 RepID=UPI001BE86C39|nr:META domain-containing protein [Halomonas sp. ISL-56]MBT2773748.1 META domain-containing protein [Halomonas sp. ISL-60]MBT2801781.1 META domain-containing protein [Halomonas sp. ISL-56]